MASVMAIRASLSPEPGRRRGFTGTSLSPPSTPTSTTTATVHPATDSSSNKFAVSEHDDDSSFINHEKRESPKMNHQKTLGPIPWTSTLNSNSDNDKPLHRRSISSPMFDTASANINNTSRLSKSPIRKHRFAAASSPNTMSLFHQSRLLLETSLNNNSSSTTNNSLLNTSRVSFQNPYSPKPVVMNSLNKSGPQQQQQQDQQQQQEQETDQTDTTTTNNNNNLENHKKREHEKTFLVYVKQLKSDLDHERNLVKQLLTQEREFQQEKEAIGKERTQHRTEMKQMTDKLFLARREADIKERDLQKALNDMQAWRRLAEESRVRERELEYELIQARKHRLQIKRSQFVQKMMFIVGRKTGKSYSTSASTKRQMFEEMNAEIDRLQKENSRLNSLLLEKRKVEQFEWSKDELLFASKSLVEFNLQPENIVDDENESKSANVTMKNADAPRFSNKKDLEESLVRSFQNKHISMN